MNHKKDTYSLKNDMCGSTNPKQQLTTQATIKASKSYCCEQAIKIKGYIR